MISGRFQWRKPGAGLPGRIGLAAFDFASGTLVMTEASSKKRAWLRAVEGRRELESLDPGGLEPLSARPAELAAALRRENRTLKRALTDPRILSGIGNAYSDEVLHAAGLSPLRRTHDLEDGELERLVTAVRKTLTAWKDRLCSEAREAFPAKVTAFRPEMAVHGRFGEPCPVCGSPVQRIVYASNEANYCATCQTGGKLLADRALSRLPEGRLAQAHRRAGGPLGARHAPTRERSSAPPCASGTRTSSAPSSAPRRSVEEQASRPPRGDLDAHLPDQLQGPLDRLSVPCCCPPCSPRGRGTPGRRRVRTSRTRSAPS